MNRRYFLSSLFLSAVLLTPSVCQAQNSCQGLEGTVDEMGAFDTALANGLSTVLKKMTTNLGVDEAAEARPSSVQISAPSASGSSIGSLVDGAETPSVIGMALDSGVVESADGKLTLNLNAFALKTLFDPSAWTDQVEYEKSAFLRRFSATVSLGGKGEKFDRDGDGKADDPLEAKALDDIITWEGRVRLTKSRDRREKKNWETFYTKTAEDSAVVAGIESAILARLNALPGYSDLRAKKNGQPVPCVKQDQYEAFFKKPDVLAALEDLLKELGRKQKNLTEAWDKAAEEVSKRFVLSLVVGGVERKTDFGPGKEYVALRGDHPLGGDRTLKLNAEWNRMESLMAGAPDPETTKIGLEASTLWLKGLKGSKLFGSESLVAKNGIETALAATWEKFDNVPDTPHDKIWKVSAKLEIPLMKGLKLPVSVTYADHVDLLSKEDEVIGHIGLSWDLSKLMKKNNSSGEPSSSGGG